jgi:hypothetical protein
MLQFLFSASFFRFRFLQQGIFRDFSRFEPTIFCSLISRFRFSNFRVPRSAIFCFARLSLLLVFVSAPSPVPTSPTALLLVDDESQNNLRFQSHSQQERKAR